MDEIEVQFPRPCDEAWENMTPRGCNRHCAACDKLIHDLEHMTGDQVNAFLESGEEACVRAKIGADGLVKLADSRTSQVTRIRNVAIGATAGLALAACATTKSPTYGFWVHDFSPASTVAGELPTSEIGGKVVLVGQSQTYENEADQADRYQFTNVEPGFYRLELGEPSGYCDGQQVALVEVGEDQTFISRIEWRDNCIIVGKMTPADPPQSA